MQSPQHARSRDQYTVGWIAALDCELTAAMSMLDEEHEQPHDFERGPNDDNVYVWGEINNHNIAIACLKSGVYGATSAATTAMRLLSAFPNIKFGLMVGIGAGVPQRGNKPDIRLGDVVVSEPDGSTGGVYLYDLVKAKSGGVSEPKGFLNAPPGILLKTLTRLRAEHKLKGMDIQRHLDKITPNMAEPDDDTPGFVYQGTENDRLFKADSLHVDGDDCESCTTTEQVKRKERPRPTRPRFHYGIIASGNTLVKDAAHRDELVKRVPGGCLCLEMEAAGLMNDFPCLVIRGICDYADTHKNDQWQPYAAITAAAYARELLHFVPREEVEKAVNASEVMQGIVRVLEANQNTTEDNNQRLREAGIRAWLSWVEPESNWATARSQCYSSTGQWFLDSQEFAVWKEQPGSFLWLHGRPGSGKTILSSTIIDHLRRIKPPSTSKEAILFYYFDFKDTSKRSTSNFIRTLLVQLSIASDDSWKELEELHDVYKGNSQPLDSDVMKTFQSISVKFGRIMIVLDALDEAIESERTVLIQRIIEIIRTPTANIHLIATSRREQDIERALEKAKPVALDLTRDAVNQDIRRYIRARIRDSEKHPKLQQRWESRPDVQQEIETTLSDKADGMFRWAACQLDAIEDCVDLRTLRKTLKELPATLDETYERILQRMTPNQRDSCVRLLQLLTFAERPLKVSEAVDAYAVDPSDSPAFSAEYRLPVPLEIVTVCGTLVTFGKSGKLRDLDESTTLQLAHFSVKEYITSTRLRSKELWPEFDPVNAHFSIMRICLGYITSVPAHGDRHSFPFLDYADKWTTHAWHLEDGKDLFGIILDFFRHHDAYSTWAKRVWGRKWNHYRMEHEGAPPLAHICIFARLKRTMLKLITSLEYLELQSRSDVPDLVKGAHHIGRSPFFYSLLYTASDLRRTDVLRALIAEGEQVHGKGGPEGTALNVACFKHDSQSAEIILTYGSAPAEMYSNYIHSAMESLMQIKRRAQPYIIIMSKLLEKIEHRDINNTCLDTALLGAFTIADLAMIRKLITRGASFLTVAQRTDLLENRLTNHQLSSIRKLLRETNMEHSIFKAIRGLEEQSYWKDIRTCGVLAKSLREELFALVLGLPLSTKSSSTCEELSEPPQRDPIHQEILWNGRRPCQSFTDVEVHGQTPLRLWAEKGRANLVELLLRAAADVNAADKSGNTAAHHAAGNDNLDALKVLVRYGADLGVENCKGNTPYMSAMHPGEHRQDERPCTSVVEWMRAKHPVYAIFQWR